VSKQISSLNVANGAYAEGTFIPENDPWIGLVKAVRSGDREAAPKLLGCVAPCMMSVIRKMVFNSADTEDLLQDALVAFLGALPRFRHTASTRHFACRVAVLTCMAYRRKQRPWYRRLWTDPELLQDMAGTDPLPSASIVAKQQQAAIRALVERLPAAQAEVLLMHVVAEFSLPEVADTLGIPLETARSRLRLALGRLRKSIVVSDQSLQDWIGET
jgi:RNA polymerase sigma-70 factor, ECF subfamily